MHFYLINLLNNLYPAYGILHSPFPFWDCPSSKHLKTLLKKFCYQAKLIFCCIFNEKSTCILYVCFFFYLLDSLSIFLTLQFLYYSNLKLYQKKDILTVPSNQTQNLGSPWCTNALFLLQLICELRFWFSARARGSKQHYLSLWHWNTVHFLK